MNTKRTPPHNLDAEESLLGAMLLSRTAIAAAEAAGVTSSDFYLPKHGHLFDAVMSVYAQREPVDLVTVANELRRADLLDAVGGDAWLRVTQTSTPASANAGAYARVVHELAMSRRVIGLGEDLAEMGYEGGLAAELVDRAATLIASLGAEVGDPAWRPVDLGPILRGDYEPTVPIVGLNRSDGLALLYPGKEHTVIGEMESGKSWFCTASAVEELLHDHVVVYVHYEEVDPTDTVERLIALRVPPGLITKNFLFVGPDTPVRHGSIDVLLAAAPTLVINDGVNEAMSLHGWGIHDEDGAAAYRRHLVKPFTAVGAAVLSADHVVKDREKTRPRCARLDPQGQRADRLAGAHQERRTVRARADAAARTCSSPRTVPAISVDEDARPGCPARHSSASWWSTTHGRPTTYSR